MYTVSILLGAGERTKSCNRINPASVVWTNIEFSRNISPHVVTAIRINTFNFPNIPLPPPSLKNALFLSQSNSSSTFVLLGTVIWEPFIKNRIQSHELYCDWWCRSMVGKSVAVIIHAGQCNAWTDSFNRFRAVETHGVQFLQPDHDISQRYTDADFAEPHGALQRRRTAPVVRQLPPIWHQDSDPKLFSSKKLLPLEKCKLIAWFCSYQLRIDLWQAASGKSTSTRCKIIFLITSTAIAVIWRVRRAQNSPQCNNLLDDYKFYLSAEISLCPD